MSWIIGAIAIYCVLAAGLIIILSMFSSRLSRLEEHDEVWDVEQGPAEQRFEKNYSHVSSST